MGRTTPSSQQNHSPSKRIDSGHFFPRYVPGEQPAIIGMSDRGHCNGFVRCICGKYLLTSNANALTTIARVNLAGMVLQPIAIAVELLALLFGLSKLLRSGVDFDFKCH